ncbi:hypothetical protein [Pontibacter mangrovi]|uniref:Uncharacterized protein n=1 Tax=Pontibacter mangrovi TaxID=2589816 RepID=A0A501W3X4_9BACT|nr:hypothetical protein [Pontibacter mangrovi]TPE43988.1 hypothetical protein FJM65_11220 [Pontibacter mangrovi]
MIKFRIGSRGYTIAEDWPELDVKQLLGTVPFLYADKTDFGVRLNLLEVLVPMLKRKHVMQLSVDDRYDLLLLTSWVWEKPLSTSKISQFKFKDQVYLLPKQNLDDMMAAEFAFADLFLKQFVDSSEPKMLDLLVATLCRPAKPAAAMQTPDWDGVEREKYNGAIAERRALEFAGLDIATKVVVLHHFIEQKRFVFDTYDIFSKGGEGGSGGGFDIGWVALIFELAEMGIFGDFDKVSFTNMNTLCLYLHNKKQQRHDK